MPPNNQPIQPSRPQQPAVDFNNVTNPTPQPTSLPQNQPTTAAQPQATVNNNLPPQNQNNPQKQVNPQQNKKNTKTKNKKQVANTSQKSLLFSEIRDGMVIMNDGSFRAVIACKSINFDLMSSREREGVEYSYQNFLNALYFPIQIFVRSQKIDINPYLDRLDKLKTSQDNMLLGVLMEDYINFIDILAQEANIMDKSFFITVPFFPEGDVNTIVRQSKGFLSAFFPKDNSNQHIKIDQVAYTKAKEEIKNRVDAVMSGLFQIGIKCVQLNTKELGELYYNVYNPDTAVHQPLGDFENSTATYIKKGQGESKIIQENK